MKPLDTISPVAILTPYKHGDTDMIKSAAELIPTPFMVEVEVYPAGRNGPAEYAEVEADEDLVFQAFEEITQRYMPEIERRVEELRERRIWDAEDRA